MTNKQFNSLAGQMWLMVSFIAPDSTGRLLALILGIIILNWDKIQKFKNS